MPETITLELTREQAATLYAVLYEGVLGNVHNSPRKHTHAILLTMRQAGVQSCDTDVLAACGLVRGRLDYLDYPPPPLTLTTLAERVAKLEKKQG